MSLSILLAVLPLVPSVNDPDPDWPQFRGPGGRAVADDTPIPTRFGPDEGVLWRTELPAGQSSPCIAGDLVFVTGVEGGKNVALAIRCSSGEVAWRKTFGGSEPRSQLHPDAATASPTPVADEEHVVFYFGDYGLVALDRDGDVLWEKRMPDPRHAFGVGTSPLLFDGMLVLSRDGAPEAAVLVMDVTDGTELWRIDRFEYSESHGSPFLWRTPDRDELVVGGTNKLCSYDLVTGEQLWVVDGLTQFPCTTPTADEDTLYFAAWSTPNATGRSFWEGAFARALDLSDEEVADPGLIFARLDKNKDGKVVLDELPESRAKDGFFFMDNDRSGAWELEEFADPPNSAPGKNLMVAVARGAKGDASNGHVRWTWTRGLPYVASPLLYRGRVWLFKSGGLATCLDAKTGEPVFDRARLPDRSEYYMSPVGAAGHVLVGSAEGTLYLLDAGADELKVEHTAVFDDGLLATPAVLDGNVYVRSTSALWAFGSPAK